MLSGTGITSKIVHDIKGQRLLSVRWNSTVEPLEYTYIDRSRRAEALRASDRTWAVCKARAAKTGRRARRSRRFSDRTMACKAKTAKDQVYAPQL